MDALLHEIKIPRVVTSKFKNGTKFRMLIWVRQCKKGRLGYRHSRGNC